MKKTIYLQQLNKMGSLKYLQIFVNNRFYKSFFVPYRFEHITVVAAELVPVLPFSVTNQWPCAKCKKFTASIEYMDMIGFVAMFNELQIKTEDGRLILL